MITLSILIAIHNSPWCLVLALVIGFGAVRPRQVPVSGELIFRQMATVVGACASLSLVAILTFCHKKYL